MKDYVMLIKLVLLFVCMLGLQGFAYSQLTPVDTVKTDSLRFHVNKMPEPSENLDEQYDIGDLFRDVFYRNRTVDSNRKKSGITIIPNVALNPTIGSQIGIKAVAGIKVGSDPKTLMSVAATSASITTKGILYFYITHNVFTNANKWNLQGSLIAARTVSPDFGVGIGNNSGTTEEDKILSNAGRKGRVLQSLYFNFREKVYKEIYANLFLGAGFSFDVRNNIKERNVADSEQTPYNIYNKRYGFDPDKYMSNGLLFSAQYTTRDNQNRAYKGMYAAVDFRGNQTWLGSTKDAIQLTTDFRKYFGLSKRRPEHVIAVWNWGSYVVSGVLPYLELSGTGRDPGSRSGRGYTVTYFKGTEYNYSELEYRFPITKNNFLSGVAFFHVQTANDDAGTKLFEKWQPGGGGGLRILFNKATRTNLCIDYAFGKYGARGFFLGLNEAF